MDLREMTAERREEVRAKLAYFLQDDPFAVKFCEDLLFVAHLWDDLIDKDKPRTDEEINRAFQKALAEIPNNPFYQVHFQMLWALTTNALLQWQDANQMANGNGDSRLTSFILRNALMSVIYFAMFLKGQDKWVAEKGVEFWEYFCGGVEEKYRQDLKEVCDA